MEMLGLDGEDAQSKNKDNMKGHNQQKLVCALRSRAGSGGGRLKAAMRLSKGLGSLQLSLAWTLALPQGGTPGVQGGSSGGGWGWLGGHWSSQLGRPPCCTLPCP